MVKIRLYDFASSRFIRESELCAVPQVGEYYMDTPEVTPDWKEHYFIVRGVTYLEGGAVGVHIEKYDPEEEANKISDLLKEINDGWKERKRQKAEKISEMEEAREGTNQETEQET